MSNELVKHVGPKAGELSISDLGQLMAKSGFFVDAKEAAQAIVKIQAGHELGISPVAAMMGIHFVKGKMTLSANTMAGLVRRSGKYDFVVKKMTDEVVELDFYANGKLLGPSTFTKADAKRAGTGSGIGGMEKFPKNMLFARAMSNGVKFYCPDIFLGGMYTPDEIEDGVEHADTPAYTRDLNSIVEQAVQPTEPEVISVSPAPEVVVKDGGQEPKVPGVPKPTDKIEDILYWSDKQLQADGLTDAQIKKADEDFSARRGIANLTTGKQEDLKAWIDAVASGKVSKFYKNK